MKVASSTARLIAASVVLQDEQKVAAIWLPSMTIALSRAMMQSTGVATRLLLKGLRIAWVRGLLKTIESSLLPGIQAHYLLRKNHIAIRVRQMISAGRTQTLFLGAGIDGLAAELGISHPELVIAEFDHPQTQSIKRRILASILPKSSVRLVPIDLSRSSVADTLEAAGFQRNEPTVIVAEGVLMYLPPRACLSVLRDVSRYFNADLDIAFTAMELDRRERPGFARAHPWIEHWLRWRGEPFLWGCGPTRMARLLKSKGFEVHSIMRGDERPERELAGWTPCTGEALYFTSRASQSEIRNSRNQ